MDFNECISVKKCFLENTHSFSATENCLLFVICMKCT